MKEDSFGSTTGQADDSLTLHWFSCEDFWNGNTQNFSQCFQPILALSFVLTNKCTPDQPIPIPCKEKPWQETSFPPQPDIIADGTTAKFTLII